jgi:transcriptional regulator with XRE-family HTH domain
MNEPNEYSLRIAAIRHSRCLSITSFAHELGIPRTTLSGWEKQGKMVSIEILQNLQEQYQININWFLTGEGNMYLTPEPKPAIPIDAPTPLTREFQQLISTTMEPCIEKFEIMIQNINERLSRIEKSLEK